MNFRTTLGLLLLLLAVGLFYWLIRDEQTAAERQRILAERASADGIALWPDPAPGAGDVAHLRIEPAGGPAVILEREGDGWRETAPVSHPARTWSVRDLLETVLSLKWYERLEPGEAPPAAELELDPPRTRLTVEWTGDAGRDPVTFHVGRLSVSGRGYLAWDRDEHVYLADDRLHELVLDPERGQWRRRRVESPGEPEAARFALRRAGTLVKAVKQEGRWVGQGPVSGRLDREAVGELLGAAGNLRIERFVADHPEDLARYGLDHPAIELEVVSAGRTSATQPATRPETATAPATRGPEEAAAHRLLLGSPTDLSETHRYAAWTARGEPVTMVFTVPASVAETLSVSVNDLRDPRLVVARASDVTAIRIRRPEGDALAFDRAGDTWRFTEPETGFEADSGLVQQLAETLAGAEAETFVPLEGAYDRPELARVEIEQIGRSTAEVLRLWAGEEGALIARRHEEPVGYRLPRERLAELFEPPIRFRHRDVAAFEAEAIERLLIERPDGVTYRIERGEARDDEEAEPASPPLALAGTVAGEPEAIEALTGALAPVRAERWLAGAPAEVPPFGASALRLRITLEDGTERVLVLDPESRRAAFDGAEHAFRASAPLAEALTAEFRERTVLPAEGSHVRKLVRTLNGRSLTLESDGAQAPEAAGGVAIDADRAAALLEALAGLEVVRYRPAPEAPGEPAAVFEITMADGRSYRLELMSTPGSPTGRIDPAPSEATRWFILDGELAETLTAEIRQGGE